MVERKYDSGARQSVERSAQEQRKSSEDVTSRTLYKVPLCSDYEGVYGKGRFAPGEMITRARNWV